MNCPQCGGPMRTADTRKTEGGSVVVRIRRCPSKRCGWTVATDERKIERPPKSHA